MVNQALKINTHDILFIDDTLVNIEASKIVGWNTCLAKGYELDKIKIILRNF